MSGMDDILRTRLVEAQRACETAHEGKEQAFDRRRQVFVEADAAGIPRGEIARVCGISPGAVSQQFTIIQRT